MGGTPVPIPNTMVKPHPADGTILEPIWESRWPPDIKTKQEIPKGREFSQPSEGKKDMPEKSFAL